MSQARILMTLIVFAFVSIILVFADDEDSAGVGKRADWNISFSYEGDTELRDAAMDARASLDGFVERLPELRATGAFTSVKFPLIENDITEHVWMSDVAFDGETLTGYLASEPLHHAGWSFGDRVSVPVDHVLDWAVIDDGTLYGGFSIYVLRRRSSPEDRQTHDEHRGFALGDQAVVWE